VMAPIVGVTRVEQLTDAISAVEVELSEADVALLEEPYVPHPVAGHV
jgi:1-deoxyxylulose-5-phosphate synthase